MQPDRVFLKGQRCSSWDGVIVAALHREWSTRRHTEPSHKWCCQRIAGPIDQTCPCGKTIAARLQRPIENAVSCQKPTAVTKTGHGVADVIHRVELSIAPGR